MNGWSSEPKSLGLTTGVQHHEHPRSRVRNDCLEAGPSSHTTMGPRFLIPVQTSLGDGPLAGSKEGSGKRERWKEEENCKCYDDGRNGLNLDIKSMKSNSGRYSRGIPRKGTAI